MRHSEKQLVATLDQLLVALLLSYQAATFLSLVQVVHNQQYDEEYQQQ